MRFLVLQHVDVEHPGMFRNYMQDEGIDWDTVELDMGEPVPDVSPYDALIVMGGPMDVWETAEHPWLVKEMETIRDWVLTRRRPFIGVCLGHQLLAAATDGEVGRAAQGEVGILPVSLSAPGHAHPFMNAVAPRFECLQWHAAEVSRPPPEATILARSQACTVQAMAIGTHALSIQFHVEITATTVEDWAAIPAYSQSLEASLGPGAVGTLRSQAAAHMSAFNALARQLYDNWRGTAFDG